MKVAFVNSSFQEDVPKNTRNIMMAKALRANGVETVFYTPLRKKGTATTRYEGKDPIASVFVPCWVPFFSRYKEVFQNKSILFRRIIDLMEYLVYVIRIQRRLCNDHIDAYLILHLWDSTITLLSPALSRTRPTAILWMGFSLRWHAKFNRLYRLLVPLYGLVLRKTAILTPIDAEQKICLFKILKLQNVYRFNPCIVDEQLFHPLDKDECAKYVRFDTTKTNILSMCTILDPQRIESHRASDYAKNIFNAVELFRWLVKENSKVHFHIVGTGDGIHKLKSKIFYYGLQDNITVHGWIEDDVRPIFVNAADLIINPYPLLEFNDATAIFEAFLCGKPVVAFKRYPWIPTDHRGGFLIDMDPKMGARQIALRLDSLYLENKSKEAKHIPYDHDVPMSVWGKRLAKILKEILREHT